MKQLFLGITIVIALLIYCAPAKAQWTRLTPAYPSDLRVADIAVKDSAVFGVGYRFSDFQGHVFRSFNNGTSWDTLQVPPAGELFETITFKDADTALIGGFGSTSIFLRSVDAGHSWAYFLEDTTTTGIADMVFLDGRRGFAAGYDTAQFYSGNCYYTEDGGNSWSQQTTDTGTCLDTLGLDYIDFVDVQTGYAVSNFVPHKYLLKTTDTGKHWNIIHTQDGIGGVYFWNVLNGIMVAQGGHIFKTSDGGMNWVPKPSPVTVPLFSVSFINSNIGFAVGGGGTVIKSVDGGETWTTETSSVTQPLFRVKCFNGRGYACGDGGTIVRSEAVLEANTIPLNYQLNVYPNPASSILNISSTTGQYFKTLAATLMDINGRIISTAKTEQKLIRMDIKDLPSGTYTIIVNADGREYIQKITISH